MRPRTAELVVNGRLPWPALAVSVKRWHDRDRSGWWLLLNLMPVVGWLWALVGNGLLRGTARPYRCDDGPPAAARQGRRFNTFG